MKRAVSLMELLIVMGIIALIAAITIPTIRHYLPSWQVSAVASLIQGKLRQAQEEAVTTQIIHGVCFYTETTPNEVDLVKYHSEILPPNDPVEVLEKVKLPNNIKLSVSFTLVSGPLGRTNCIFFGSNGAPKQYGDINVYQDDVSSENFRKRLEISPAGVVKVYSTLASPTPTPSAIPTPTQSATEPPLITPTPTITAPVMAIIRPDGETVNNSWGNYEAPTTYQAINENVTQPTAGSTDSYVEAYDLDANLELSLSSITGVTNVSNIKIWVYAKSEMPSASSNIGLQYHTSGPYSEVKSIATTDSWAWYSREWTTGLSQNELNDLKIDFWINPSGVGMGNWIATAYVEITYM